MGDGAMTCPGCAACKCGRAAHDAAEIERLRDEVRSAAVRGHGAGQEEGRRAGFIAGWNQSLRAAADVIGKAKKHWYGSEVADWLRTFSEKCEDPPSPPIAPSGCDALCALPPGHPPGCVDAYGGSLGRVGSRRCRYGAQVCTHKQCQGG